MKIFFLFLSLLITQVWAQPKTETFVIQIADRSMTVLSPDQKKSTFSVIIENKSLSDQIGKMIVQGKILKFVSIKSGLSEAIEIENKSAENVFFVPVSPAFQEVELVFGKKVYEIPSKK